MRDPENDTEQFWDHCWLNVNNQDWWIGAIEMEWATGKRWLRLWRDEIVDGTTQVALVSIDYSRVDWDEYNRIAQELMHEAWGEKGWKTKETTAKIVSARSTTTKRSRKRLLAG